jgi:hypothetical protein
MRLNNWSIAASYDTARIFAGLGFGSSTASRSIISRPACGKAGQAAVISHAAPVSETCCGYYVDALCSNM